MRSESECKEIEQSVHDIIQGFKDDGCKTIDDVYPIFFESPFVYKGMPLDECEKEMIYYYCHTFDEIYSYNYTPLWKQKRN